ncbi:MAG: hypothetical protein LUH05_04525 [Candidatus Gastranaerophilales bacterium]|nr:hypothetical protein [Candidatus Gastranaerophilales bacterium]
MLYNHKNSLASGNIFKTACSILQNELQKGINDKKDCKKVNMQCALFVPIIVNAAFACELFFKSMLTQKVRKHKLDELFIKLDTDIQENIRKLVKNKMMDKKLKCSNDDFDNYLKKNGDVFVIWRYFFERTDPISVDFQFVISLMESAYEVAKEQKS